MEISGVDPGGNFIDHVLLGCSEVGSAFGSSRFGLEKKVLFLALEKKGSVQYNSLRKEKKK